MALAPLLDQLLPLTFEGVTCSLDFFLGALTGGRNAVCSYEWRIVGRFL